MRKFLLICLFSIGTLFAQESEDSFYIANEKFAVGDYATAKELYTQLIETSAQPWQVYYNLGNAHYELNEAGSAALNWQKALRLSPQNKDLLHNLEMLEDKIEHKAERFPVLFYKRWWQGIQRTFLSKQWFWLAILFIWAAAGLRTWWIYKGRTEQNLRRGSLMSFCLSLLFLFFSWQMQQYQFNKKQAVLVQSEVKIKNGPSSQSKDIFTLSEGNTLSILEQEKSWYKVRFRDGREGWVERRSFEVI